MYQDPVSKKMRKRAGDMAQGVKHLPSKHETPSTNLSTAKKKKLFSCATTVMCADVYQII
jgi:hypothetical protein